MGIGKREIGIGISVDGKVTLDHVSHWMPLTAPPTCSEKPNNCKKFDMKGYENVIIHEGNAKGGILKGGKK